jgi:hypothetical protein
LWEELYFPCDLTVLSTYTDYEGDGYSDLQEYLNQQNSEIDLENAPFNPMVVNAPGGTGYHNKRNFWLLMMPVKMNNGSAH